MKKYFLIFPLVVFGVLFSSCVSKRLTKQGLKYEEAGMFDLAAQSYLGAVQANTNNIDARIGLKKTGQRVIDTKNQTIFRAYQNGDDKGVVYGYLELKSWYDQVAALSVDLDLPESALEYYNESKPKYLEKKYNEAQLLLEEEKFKQSEEIFSEILQIEPGYSSADELKRVTKCEPVYREGKQYLNTGFFRKAYSNFDRLIKDYGTYKDSKELREESLSKGIIAISMNKTGNISLKNKNITVLIDSKIKASLNNLNNPFIVVVDSQNTDQIIQEQQRGINQGSTTEVGKIITPNALFTGLVDRFNINEGKLVKQEKRGYLKEELTSKDPKTGEVKKEYKYHKVIYFVYQQRNSVSCSFQYHLSSVKSAKLLVSDAFDVTSSDEMMYATYEGNASKLVPGYWEDIKKDSPNDKVATSPSEVAELQDLLRANKNIRKVEVLQTDVIEQLAERVASRINKYNPEEH